jgi:predicted amidohydrolase YtcJ
MSRLEAVRSFTSWNAWATGQEAELGSLEPGKRADLVVLDEDVFTCDEAAIKDITPVATMVGGDWVFERRGQPVGGVGEERRSLPPTSTRRTT